MPAHRTKGKILLDGWAGTSNETLKSESFAGQKCETVREMSRLMFDLWGHVLILTGAPGSGKSTTAERLVAAVSGPAVHLRSDEFWGFIKNGRIQPWLPEAHKQNEVVMGILAQAAEGYANGGYFVVLDGIVVPWFLHPFRKLRRPIHYVVLRPGLDATIKRSQQRGGESLRDPGTISALHREFLAMGELENHVIETTAHTPDDTQAAVQAALASGRFRLV
jgi:chloramphenicol 3-O-phosphotransferase